MKMRSFHDIFICTISFLLCFSMGISLIIGDQKSFSEEENRSLQTLNIYQLFDRELFAYLNKFCSDQFPMRSGLLSLSGITGRTLDTIEQNGVILANDGYLIARHDYTDFKILTQNTEMIGAFLEKMTSANMPTRLIIAPRTIDVMKSKLNPLFPNNYGTYEYALLLQGIGAEHLIDPLGYLKYCADNGEYVYYKTDHHWTTLGAYRAYEQIALHLNLSPYEQDFFTVQYVSDKFYGTTHSRVMQKNTAADEIYLYRYDKDTEFKLSYSNQNTSELSSFYDMSVISDNAKDKYKVFLSGNTDLLLIRAQGSERPRLLLIKDSFANSLIPFLALHYDIDVIDPRYYKGSIKDHITENDFDAVLILYGIDTLATDMSCGNILK